MPFLGKSPKAGNYILLDSITTSATATYNLTRNSTAYFPASARNLIVSLNGITQAPDTAYSVSGSTITFSSALTSSDVIDYILVLGDVLSIGTPADNTVGESQLSYPLTNFSSTGIDDNAVATALTIGQHSGGSGASLGIGNTSPSVYSGTSSLEIGDQTGEAELSMYGQYQTYIHMQADGGSTSGYRGKHVLYVFNDGSNNITVDNRLYSPRTSAGGYNTYKYYLDSSTGTSDYATFYTDGYERLRIDGSGNVGIGTSNPSAPLDIYKNLDGEKVLAKFQNRQNSSANTASSIAIVTDQAEARLRVDRDGAGNSASLVFGTTNAGTLGDRVTIDPNGNVGIGTSGPQAQLDVRNSSAGAAVTVEGSGGITGCITSGTGTNGTFISTQDTAVMGLTFGIHGTRNASTGHFNNTSIKMVIDTSGNVGIGTTDPQSRLDLYGTSSPPTYKGRIRISGGSATAEGGIEFINTSFGSGYGWRVDAPDEGSGSTPIIFRNRSNTATWTERVRIDANGNLNIGTTSNPLFNSTGEINIISATGDGINLKQLSSGNNVINLWSTGTSNNAMMVFYKGNTQVAVGSISSNTTATAFNTSSDYRLKENIVDLTNAIDRVKQLSARRFNFIIKPDVTVDGFIAHEVASVVPEAITGEKDEVYGSGEPKYQGIDLSKLVPLLTAAIKEQQVMIEDLQTRLAAVESN